MSKTDDCNSATEWIRNFFFVASDALVSHFGPIPRDFVPSSEASDWQPRLFNGRLPTDLVLFYSPSLQKHIGVYNIFTVILRDPLNEAPGCLRPKNYQAPKYGYGMSQSKKNQ